MCSLQELYEADVVPVCMFHLQNYSRNYDKIRYCVFVLKTELHFGLYRAV